MYGAPSNQPTQELNGEELLLEQPLLQLGTDGARAIEVGGDIVRSAVGAPGKLLPHLNFEGWGWSMISDVLQTLVSRNSACKKLTTDFHVYEKCFETLRA